ncbi:hypothetical protein AVEN_157438-1 [Araneus ventricosus]|uniref:Uncharacterized protein n=1 Tax=Araneus ventricosus TaxID=182803 RepID=A0A4Y2V3Z4_ARAVE|nr:hypothetical protein AVEN_157438-1 [Araneus ventricosus]
MWHRFLYTNYLSGRGQRIRLHKASTQCDPLSSFNVISFETECDASFSMVSDMGLFSLCLPLIPFWRRFYADMGLTDYLPAFHGSKP